MRNEGSGWVGNGERERGYWAYKEMGRHRIENVWCLRFMIMRW